MLNPGSRSVAAASSGRIVQLRPVSGTGLRPGNLASSVGGIMTTVIGLGGLFPSGAASRCHGGAMTAAIARCRAADIVTAVFWRAGIAEWRLVEAPIIGHRLVESEVTAEDPQVSARRPPIFAPPGPECNSPRRRAQPRARTSFRVGPTAIPGDVSQWPSNLSAVRVITIHGISAGIRPGGGAI